MFLTRISALLYIFFAFLSVTSWILCVVSWYKSKQKKNIHSVCSHAEINPLKFFPFSLPFFPIKSTRNLFLSVSSFFSPFSFYCVFIRLGNDPPVESYLSQGVSEWCDSFRLFGSSTFSAYDTFATPCVAFTFAKVDSNTVSRSRSSSSIHTLSKECQQDISFMSHTF